MKAYRLEITDKDGKTPVDDERNPIGPFDTRNTFGAGLQLEFDALITGYDVVSSGTSIALYGIPISMIRQSANLAGCQVNLYAGFDRGLPLANPDQWGLIIRGEIFNPYGNWMGTHQSLNLIVNPSAVLNDKGQVTEITVEGKKGELFSDVLMRALKTAYPKFQIEISISDKLVLQEDGKGVYPRLAALAASMRSQSYYVINDQSYSGVQMVMQGDSIRVFDNTGGKGNAIQILPHELIGQPTWIGVNTVSFKCPLRSEIRLGDMVELPLNIISGPGELLAVNSERSYSSIRDKVNFSGKFQINSVRHVGDYLSADNSNSRVTIYEALVMPKELK
ncbi:hypothetical protein [Enterobacter asburiae]|uniref:hypothetical protein n=1 Tax=Enterobacter asburiae TaxID=61645 RepID=UPI001CBC9C36|nr:hypothetical protein [Enterobacter asburiae]UAN38026.1 hypothetical protein KGP18_08925 [Enterobacter asburiae]